MHVGKLVHGKRRETSCPQFVPHFLRLMRWSYLAVEICKSFIRVKYPKDIIKMVFKLLVHYCFFSSYSKEEKETARHKQFSLSWNVQQVSESFSFSYFFFHAWFSSYLSIGILDNRICLIYFILSYLTNFYFLKYAKLQNLIKLNEMELSSMHFKGCWLLSESHASLQ